jgi:hypothetical protein
MRELQLWDAEEGLIDLFSDIVELEMQCKFSDCLHETEPGCAVKKAIRDGKLSNKRLESYRKLQREMLAVERKKNPKLAEKKKWKDIKKMAKEIKKPGNEMILLSILSFPAHFRLIMLLQTIFRYSDHVAKDSQVKRRKFIKFNSP